MVMGATLGPLQIFLRGRCWRSGLDLGARLSPDENWNTLVQRVGSLGVQRAWQCWYFGP